MRNAIPTGEPTRWEVLAIFGDGRTYLLGYSARRSRVNLVNNARAMGVGDILVSLASLTDEDHATYSDRTGWRFGDPPKLTLRYGRTQRQAVAEGEYPDTLPDPGADAK